MCECELALRNGSRIPGMKLIRIWITIHIIVISPCLSTRLGTPVRLSSQDSEKLSDDNAGHMCNIVHKRGNFTDLTAPTVQRINSRLFKINVTNDGYIAVGESFVVECSAEQKIGVFYSPKLLTPVSLRGRVEEECYYQATNDPYKKLYTWRKIIKNAHKLDEGNYSCVMDDDSRIPPTRTQLIKVFGDTEHFLNVTAEKTNITVTPGNTAKWILSIKSFPLNFTQVLQRNDYQEVVQATLTKVGGQRFKLEINRVTLQDMGPYKFHVYLDAHPQEHKTLDLYLTVKSPPILRIESDGPEEAPINCMFGQTCTISCKVEANPPPQNYWTWRMCNSTSICRPGKKVMETYNKQIEYGFVSSIEFNGTHHGNYTCHANNSQTPNEVSITKQIRIVDYPGSTAITIINPEEVVEGDDLKLVCVSSKFDYYENITWVQADGTTTKPVGQAKFTTDETKWSRRHTLEIKNIDQSATGTYRCTTGGSNPKLEASYHLDVLSIASPQFLESTNLNNSKASVRLGEAMELICNVSGRPKPVISWMWNNHPMREWGKVGELKELKYSLSKDASVLLLKYVPSEAQGRFKCKAQNRNGTSTAFLDVTLKGSQTFSSMASATIISLLLVLTICVAILVRYKYKQGIRRRFMEDLYQKEFYDGDVDKINPEISVSDQAYLLPYDKRFEFPSEHLKLGKQIGAGAFGCVVKAEAIGILTAGQESTVAVKMVKPGADENHLKALMSELKIMVHLRKHVNIVNLLGACTKWLAKKKQLLIIVEYCKYGSLLSYMHRNKGTFINQLDPTSGKIDPKIGRCIDRNQLEAQRTLHYAELTFVDNSYSEGPDENGYTTLKELVGPNLQGKGIINAKSVPAKATELHGEYSEVSSSEGDSVSDFGDYSSQSSPPVSSDEITEHTSSCESSCHDQYTGDYQTQEVQSVRTTDLLCWAFQISRGMEYLASRKVLHGDLAARNVLLDENKVAKICDFGMAKEMYKDYNYKKNTKGVPLPVKWMAVESILCGIFSTQSDCWSFGVVLWEMFTLGQTPYPGMEADVKFFELISKGYRMEKPKLCPCSIYNLMLECWNHEPTERPTFSTLVVRIGDMLEEGQRKHYMNLNVPHMRNNQKYISPGQTDYLLAMGNNEYEPSKTDYLIPEVRPIPPSSPDFLEQSPSSPQYETTSSSSFIHQPRLEAQNPMYGILNLSVPTEEPGEEIELHNIKKELSIHMKHLPSDLEDKNGLCRNSNSASDDVVLKYCDYANIKEGDNGIKGVSNISYVSNHNMVLNK